MTARRLPLAARICILLLTAAPGLAQDATGEWRMYAAPAAAGFDASALDAARARAERIGSAAVVVIASGHVVAAWGEVERRFECHSVRKSLASALVGIHVAAGTIDLDKTLADLRIDDAPPLSADEQQATVRQLLEARSGIYHPAAKEPADMKRERPQRGSHAAGTQFFYNNWDFNTVGAVFARCTGKDLLAQFATEIAAPLQMQDFRPADAVWQLEPSSSIHPAYAFRLSARDLARFGWMFADGGRWRGGQIVPAAWVKESTAPRTRFDDGSGYGYMWQIKPRGCLGARYPQLDQHDQFAAIGTGGQLVLVVPDAAFVFVHCADTDNGRSVSGRNVWTLAEQVLAARTGAPAASPELAPFRAVPLAGALPEPPERRAIELPSNAIDAVLGDYRSDDGVRVTMHRFEGRLFALVHGDAESELLPQAMDSFFAPFANVVVDFQRDQTGKVAGATVALPGKTIGLRRL